jgi:23S rRNA (cytidine1920-2'-O)/16S rRNA (cytidine1409-2'-O)-methyltransferase
MPRQPLISILAARYPEIGEKALAAAVLAGEVSAGGRTLTKPGILVDENVVILMRPRPRYVSRGGEKLTHALTLWDRDVRGRVLLDAGCSTGGFSDCLLQAGAARVYAVDVGYNVLDWRMRTDPRVVVMERTNVMRIAAGDMEPRPSQAVADLSFRSLRGAAAHILGLTEDREGIFLAKPQFEWTNPSRAFHGVVDGADELRAILTGLVTGLAGDGVEVRAAAESPIRGRKGNREFLLLLALRTPARAEPGISAVGALVLE